MQKPGKIFSDNWNFFLGYFLFLFLCIITFSFSSKTGSFIWLNFYHNKMLDWFFIVYTNVGDGLFAIAIFLLLLLLRRPLPGWEIVFTFLLSGLIAQIVKNIFPMPRPKTLLGDSGYSHFIDGVTHVGNASFPSGHSATAFGVALILSLFEKNKKRSMLYFFAAVLVGYSRVYLGQHFVQDVFFGSIIGVVSALIVYITIDNKPIWLRKMKAREMQYQSTNNSKIN
ncbi:MAG: phosphatase PAP2 family protein [Bacteroidetes bacterium]|nr:phosphatase PAP2 family protein [Bacteroidota bacterium]